MRSTTASGLLLAAWASVSAAQGNNNGTANYSSPTNTSSPYLPFQGDPFKKYSLSANGINASWIPYGARLTNLYVFDKNNQSQDIVVGYDNGTQYLKDTETNHTYFGAVVGRYANR